VAAAPPTALPHCPQVGLGGAIAMAPLEDLEARDLAWISDFVMQQMAIMLRPLMDHLEQSDMEVDRTQRMIHKLTLTISEAQGDIDRNSKYLSTLRQGLGVQNENRCRLERDLEGTAATMKHFSDQMEGLLSTVEGVKESVRKQGCDVRCLSDRQADLLKQADQTGGALEALQETWQREIRELRLSSSGSMATALGGIPPTTTGSGGSAGVLDSPWLQKKNLMVAAEDNGLNAGGVFNGGRSIVGDANVGNGRGLSRQSKHKPKMATQDLDAFDMQPRSSSKVWGRAAAGPSEVEDNAPADNARLPPVLMPRRTGVSASPPDRMPAEAPRLRFTATLAAKPPTRNGSNGGGSGAC